jgi:hypothetical protein
MKLVERLELFKFVFFTLIFVGMLTVYLKTRNAKISLFSAIIVLLIALFLNRTTDGFSTYTGSPLTYVQRGEEFIFNGGDNPGGKTGLQNSHICLINDNKFPPYPAAVGWSITGDNVPPNTTILWYRFAKSNYGSLYDAIFIQLNTSLTKVDRNQTFYYSATPPVTPSTVCPPPTVCPSPATCPKCPSCLPPTICPPCPACPSFPEFPTPPSLPSNPYSNYQELDEYGYEEPNCM